MKRNLCILLAALLVMAMLAGCGNGNSNDNIPRAGKLYDEELIKNSGLDFGGLEMPLSKDGERVTWAVNSEVTTLNDSYVLDKLRKLTGIDVQLDIIPPSNVKEKVQVLVASKNLDDIMAFSDDKTPVDLATQGALAPVEDYLDDVPNFKSIFVDREDTPRIFKSYKMPDGKLYGFYGYDWAREVNTGAMMYRKDIFDANGIKMWNSPETFYQALKKLKEIYPDSIPFAVKTQEKTISNIGASWGIKPFNVYYDPDEKTWKFSDVQDTYREVLDFIKKLYDEGLLDNEFATRTQADWTSLMTGKNKSFVTLDWIGRMDMFKAQTAGEIPDYDLRFANPIGPNQQMDELTQLCWARYVAKSNPKHEKLAFQLLDTVLSAGGKQLITMGIEGDTFTLDENGMAKYKDFPDVNPQMNELTEKYGMFIEGMYLSFDRRSAYFNYTEREQEAQDFAKDPSHIRPLDPVLPFTEEERTETSSILSSLQQAAKEFGIKYIVAGESDDAAWNAWKEKAKELKADRLVEIYNEAQKRYDAAK